MFDFGAFRKGYVQAEQRQEAKRAQNAQLYSDFVRNNPDANTEQRSKFAEDLAGGSEYYRSILPTRDTMQTNVSRRQAEVAEAERTKKNRAMLDQMTMMSKGADLLSPYYLSGKGDEGMSFLTEQFGGMITEDMAPYIQNVAKQKAQVEVDKIIGGRIDTWKAAGANKNDIEKLFNGFDETMLGTSRNRVKGVLADLANKDKSSFQTELNQAAKSGDAEVYKSVIDKTDTMYPNLDPADKTSIVGTLQPIMNKAEEIRQNEIDGKKELIEELAIQQMSENKMISEKEITEFMQSQYKINQIDEEVDGGSVAEIVKKQQEFRVQVLDDTETKNIRQIKNDNENNRSLTVDKKFDEALDMLAETSVDPKASDDENKQNKALLKANLRKSLDQAAMEYGINLSDPEMAAALATTLNTVRSVSGWTGPQVDPVSLKVAIQTVMSSLSVGTSTGTLERSAFARTLAELRINSLEELPAGKTVEFREGFERNRLALYDEMYDSIDPKIANLTQLGNALTNQVNTARKELDTMFKGDNSMFAQNRTILDIPLEDVIGDTTVLDHYRQRTLEFEKIYKLNTELSRMEQTETAYLKTLAEGGYLSAATKPQADMVRAKIAEIRELKAELASQGDILIGQYNQIEQRIAASKEATIEGNADGSNSGTLVEDAIITIGYNQPSMTQEQLELAINEAAKRIVRSTQVTVSDRQNRVKEKQDIEAMVAQIKQGLQANQ